MVVAELVYSLDAFSHILLTPFCGQGPEPGQQANSWLFLTAGKGVLV